MTRRVLRALGTRELIRGGARTIAQTRAGPGREALRYAIPSGHTRCSLT